MYIFLSLAQIQGLQTRIDLFQSLQAPSKMFINLNNGGFYL